MKSFCWIVLFLSFADAGLGGTFGYGPASDQELGLPPDLAALHRPDLARDIPGRIIPDLSAESDLSSPELPNRALPLTQANTLAHIHFQERRFGRLTNEQGNVELFNPESILVKFRGQSLVSALRVKPGRELHSLDALRKRADVEFAELDTFERRQFTPNDPMLVNQWHHGVIGSFQAWNYGLGNSSVRVAIVDTPFQMDHPDLIANTVNGWDVVANQPVTSSAGIAHSTLCAGMAAAVINNGLGVAGAANCQILPINIDGAISQMYNATLWAATNGVRVVNISWSGGTSAVLESAGLFLKTNASGILFMSAIDGSGLLNGPNQPDVYCVSMTDSADNFQGTMYGPYVDFAAPGYAVYGTTTGSSYATGTGCSFAVPLVAGVAAWILGRNPTLSASDVIGILTNTAVDLGPAGWDEFYGWGRINFGAAAAAASATLPNITSVQWRNSAVVIAANFRPNLSYSLWRTAQLAPPTWTQITNATIAAVSNVISLTDPNPLSGTGFYRVRASQ